MKGNNALHNHHDKMKNAKNSDIIITETLKGIFDLVLIGLCYYLSGRLTGLWYHEVNLWFYPEFGESNIVFSMKDGSFFSVTFAQYAWLCGLWFGGLICMFSLVRHFFNVVKATWRKIRHMKAVSDGTVIEGPVKYFD